MHFTYPHPCHLPIPFVLPTPCRNQPSKPREAGKPLNQIRNPCKCFCSLPIQQICTTNTDSQCTTVLKYYLYIPSSNQARAAPSSFVSAGFSDNHQQQGDEDEGDRDSGWNRERVCTKWILGSSWSSLSLWSCFDVGNYKTSQLHNAPRLCLTTSCPYNLWLLRATPSTNCQRSRWFSLTTHAC